MFSLCAHLGYLFTELPLTERPGAAARAGFRTVEHPSPYGIAAPEFRKLLDAEGLAFVQLALPAGDAAKGEKGLGALPGREDEFLRSVDTGLEYALAVGSRFIQVQSGIMPKDETFERLWEVYVGNVSKAAQRAAGCGIDVIVEPIGPGTVADYFMNHSDLALRALAEIGQPNVRLLFDVFHSTNAGIDPCGFIADHVADIGHIHVADHPGRHQPGTGSIDFVRLFRILEAVGYAGSVGCEYIPTGATEASFGWRAQHGLD